MSVCILHCAQDLEKEPEPLGHGELPLITIAGDRSAGDMLQRQERLAGLRKPRIEQSCDVGMTQAGENLALSRKPFGHLPAHQQRVHELQRYLAREQSIGTLGQPHTPHATLTEQRQHAVRAYAPADERLLASGEGCQMTSQYLTGFRQGAEAGGVRPCKQPAKYLGGS